MHQNITQFLKREYYYGHRSVSVSTVDCYSGGCWFDPGCQHINLNKKYSDHLSKSNDKPPRLFCIVKSLTCTEV